MKVLSVAAEMFPFVKTGGLADVAGALPAALRAEDVEVQSLLPGYPAVMTALGSAQEVLQFDDLFGGPARVLAGRALVLDAPHLYDRSGPVYGHADDAFRFAALCWAAAEIGSGRTGGFVPDVVHAHDWQAGLVPAYLHYVFPDRPATVFTVHNLAYQGQFPAHLLGALRLPPHAYSMDGVEYYGAIGFLKAGIRLADRVTTVSPSYAEEIRSDAAGMGLAGLLRARGADLVGVLNGIDTSVWNPATDPLLPTRYNVASLDGRQDNKRALQDALGLDPDPEAMVIGVISRLAWQKGMDLLLGSVPFCLQLGVQIALLGAGDADVESGFLAAQRREPRRIGVRIGYDEALAHLIQGGADVLCVPSRYEPCGLTQLCALRYGALPLVARVGGLADTVIDANEVALAAGVGTGFVFSPVSGDAIQSAIRRASIVWRDRAAWHALQQNAMRIDVSWQRPAQHYAALYRSLTAATISA